MATTPEAVQRIISRFNIYNLKQRGIQVTNRSASQVQELREKFLREFEKEKDAFHEKDIIKVMSDDWYVKRFLLARNRDIKEACVMMVNALKWKKSEGIHDLKATYFPEELLMLSSMFIYAPDREGNLTIYFRVKYVIKHADLVPTLKKFGNYIFRIADDATNGSGISIVADFSGTGIQNAAEADLLFDAISIASSYFPYGINHIILVDLPYVLRAVWTMAKAWVPHNRRKLIEFVSREDIGKLIDYENLPDFLGGHCSIPYGGSKVVPTGCPTLYRFVTDSLGLAEKTAVKISNMYKLPAQEIEEKLMQMDWYREDADTIVS